MFHEQLRNVVILSVAPQNLFLFIFGFLLLFNTRRSKTDINPNYSKKKGSRGFSGIRVKLFQVCRVKLGYGMRDEI